ncbi:MAG: tRNA (adenosine(37)-N6)-dimethylallyltransferase MiaA [Clostridia bacterium]|nr:tRNA (adenosine(37)-N6)-dimethylallyltransferase MiaA [Clostridia bacterium]
MLIDEILRQTEDFECGKANAIIIGGPTASGKTSLAIETALRKNGEIVSCDSMQIYKRMDIGTAKATAEEQSKVPHHMIDIIEPWINYSVFDYKEAAEKCIADIISRGKIPVICGGTGLYINSLIENRQYNPEEDPAVRAELETMADNGEYDLLYDMLCNCDPEAAEIIHKHNVKRVIRALELYRITGKTQCQRNEASHCVPPSVEYRTFIINMDRERLYERIEKRVDIMFAEGLYKETESVYNECKEAVEKGIASSGSVDELTSLAAIGYREMIRHIFFDEMSLEEVCEKIKINTRHYAKRQMTWFRKTPGAVFIDAE